MTSPSKKTTWRSTSLKIISLLLGYTFWYIFGHSHVSTAWITIPLCFYNVPKQTIIKGPENISIKVIGKRSELRLLDVDQLAIHINADQFTQGKNILTIDAQSIFLPESIKLVHYSPSQPVIEVSTAIESDRNE